MPRLPSPLKSPGTNLRKRSRPRAARPDPPPAAARVPGRRARIPEGGRRRRRTTAVSAGRPRSTTGGLGRRPAALALRYGACPMIGGTRSWCSAGSAPASPRSPSRWWPTRPRCGTWRPPAGGEEDPEWLARIEAHRAAGRSPGSTEETGADPRRLAEVLAEAKPDDTLLVDDLGGWVTALLDPARQPNDDKADVAALADGGARLPGPGGAGQPRGGPVAGADHAAGPGVRRRARARPTRRSPRPATRWCWWSPASRLAEAGRHRHGRPPVAGRSTGRPAATGPIGAAVAAAVGAGMVARTRRPPTATPERRARRSRAPRRPAGRRPGQRAPAAPGPRRRWRCRWSPPGWSSSPAWTCRCRTTTPARTPATGWPPWTSPAPGWACWSRRSGSPPPPRAPRPRGRGAPCGCC